MADLHWKSAITSVAPNELRLRGYRVDELMGGASFAEAVFLALRGELPSPTTGRLFEAILVASIDHGATPPSCLAARTSASTGAPLNAAVAAGVLSINRVHGGAGEQALECFAAGVARLGQSFSDRQVTAVAQDIVEGARAEGRRLPGFGHRIHSRDPRATRLLAMARQAGVAGDHVRVAEAIAVALEQASGRALNLNVDGAIGAVLGDLGFAPELASGLFVLARVGGLMAQVLEERQRERPMRRIHPTDHEYDGPPARDLPGERQPSPDGR